MAQTAPARPETHRICNLVPSRNTEKDWQFQHALAAGALSGPAALPASVDLRAAWWDIGDQENTGSCVGWGSAPSPACAAASRIQRASASSCVAVSYTHLTLPTKRIV